MIHIKAMSEQTRYIHHIGEHKKHCMERLKILILKENTSTLALVINWGFSRTSFLDSFGCMGFWRVHVGSVRFGWTSIFCRSKVRAKVCCRFGTRVKVITTCVCEFYNVSFKYDFNNNEGMLLRYSKCSHYLQLQHYAPLLGGWSTRQDIFYRTFLYSS